MKFEKKELQASYSRVKSAVEKNALIPILKNIRFMADCGEFKMIASNSTYQIESGGKYEGVDSFDVCIQADKFGVMLEASSGEINLSYKDSSLYAKSNKSKFKFNAVMGGDFPIIKEGSGVKIDIDLNSIIGGVGVCAAASDIRDYLKGVNIASDGTVIRATATDGHILASHSIDFICEEFNVILPNEVAAICTSQESESITICDRSACIKFADGSVLITKLISSKFPNIDSLISSDTDKSIEVSSGEINTCASISSKLGEYIKLSSSNGILAAKTADNNSEMISEIECNGDDITIAFSSMLLKKAVGLCESQYVRLLFTDKLDRIVIKDNGVTIVLMCARV